MTKRKRRIAHRAVPVGDDAAMHTCEVERTERDLFVVLDGVRIAKRGYPGTPEAETWVQLVPGYTVRDNTNLTDFIIEMDGVRVH